MPDLLLLILKCVHPLIDTLYIAYNSQNNKHYAINKFWVPLDLSKYLTLNVQVISTSHVIKIEKLFLAEILEDWNKILTGKRHTLHMH